MVSDISALTSASQSVNSTLQIQRTAQKLPAAQVEKLLPQATQQSSSKDTATFSSEALSRLVAEEETQARETT